ncbi:arginase [Peijinzhouia sedimentorum]
MRPIKLIEVKSEIAAGTRGASLGVDALKIASLDKKSTFFAEYDPISVKDENDMLYKGNKFPFAKYIDGVFTMLDRVSKTVKAERKKGKFPIILAGDHSTAAGTICGLKAAAPDKRLGVIWIDAHADMHSPYTTPSGNMHGMPLAIVCGLDNLECQVNDIDENTKQLWENIKEIGISGPKISPTDIVFMSVRSTEAPEDFLIEKYNIPNFTIRDINNRGISTVCKEALESLKDCEQIYISFDVDSLDSNISSGTGTPVENGLSIDQALEMNKELIKDKRVCCWEIVEVNPTFDHENVTAEAAFDILEETTKSLVSNF